MKKITAVLVTIAISLAMTAPAFATENNYTNVLVHGLGGWGDDSSINELSPYWGSKTGNLAEYLTQEGYNTVEASVGPFSSSWDRACELYAQLTGTTVDYGAAHSAKHNHARYGTTYLTPIIEKWNRFHKINLIGHSFGGNTVELLASLMAYGDKNELATTGENTSPLFTGNKAGYIHSVTTLCTPHNGSTLYDIVDKVPYLIPSILVIARTLGYLTDTTYLYHFYDVNLRQFCIKSFVNGIDNAGYELSPKGAIELNKSIKTVDSIYYFSYSFVTTHAEDSIQIPDSDTLFILVPTAAAMGAHNDERFLKENDGLVSVNSAQYPWDEEHVSYDAENVNPGIWNVMPTMKGHHGTIIGMDGNTEKIHDFYTNLIEMLEKI